MTELTFINNLLYQNLFLNQIITLINYNSNLFLSSANSKNENLISKEASLVIPENKELRNNSKSSESSSLFKNVEINSISDTNEEIYIGNKRSRVKRPRRDNKDNIRKRIKRGFFNNALINKLNEKLKSIGSKKYFVKFPKCFVRDGNIKRNKEILNMTLLKLFEKNEIYTNENEEGLSNYRHNLNVVQNEEIKENDKFKKILNKTFSELFTEYINSDEFNINEINRLKRKKMGDEYINRYKYLAKHLIEFFSQ